MITLTIKNFSCIDSAVIDFARLTVIIGPQASGKSVLSKLAYFTYGLLTNSFAAYSETSNLEELQQGISSSFIQLFPSSAWGSSLFEITLSAGTYSVQITRSRAKTPSVKVEFSPFFRELRQQYVEALLTARATEAARSNSSQRTTIEFNLSGEFNNKIADAVGDDYFFNMVFVPAGRSFFINTAKMNAVEISKQVDSITAAFGRTYKMLHDGSLGDRFTQVPPSRMQLAEVINAELFGGRIRISKDGQWVDAVDGRVVPFSALSSGQQELLPLWLMINFYTTIQHRGCLSFIEEPEAHLFPRAQSLLTTYLCSIVAEENRRNAMLITTHSPYVLSKINNLLYADALGIRFPRRKKAIAKIVGQNTWLSSAHIAAYAIVNRQVVAIMDEDGLIDADFLDSVSGDIAKEYGLLLDLDESLSNAR